MTITAIAYFVTVGAVCGLIAIAYVWGSYAGFERALRSLDPANSWPWVSDDTFPGYSIAMIRGRKLGMRPSALKIGHFSAYVDARHIGNYPTPDDARRAAEAHLARIEGRPPPPPPKRATGRPTVTAGPLEGWR